MVQAAVWPTMRPIVSMVSSMMSPRDRDLNFLNYLLVVPRRADA